MSDSTRRPPSREAGDPTRPWVELARTYRIEASHVLPEAPPESECARLHGHTWTIEVHVGGEIDEAAGWLIDYGEIDTAWEPIHERLDHRHLNDVEGLENPTSELLAVWIWQRLAEELDGLRAVVVHETCTARCSYYGPRPRREEPHG